MKDKVITAGRSIAISAWARWTPTSSSTTAIMGRPRGTANATAFFSQVASLAVYAGGVGAIAAIWAWGGDGSVILRAVTAFAGSDGAGASTMLASSPKVGAGEGDCDGG